MNVTDLEALEKSGSISEFIDEDGSADCHSSYENAQQQLTRSRIEIMRELIDLKKLTDPYNDDQYFDRNIFD